MGMLYKRGTMWWIKYYANGRPERESTRSDKKGVAQRFLNERLGRVATCQPIIRRADRICYEELATDLRCHYETTGSRNMREAETRLKNLDRFFAQWRAVNITSDKATTYVQARQAQGVANGTINRELAMLIKMLNLAEEHGKLLRKPRIRKLKEAPPRSGFFESRDFEAVRRRLPKDIQVAVNIGYAFGWRVQSEVLTLTLAQVDLKAGTLRLNPGTTKNDDGRVVYLPPDLKALVAAQVERVEALQRRLNRIVPYLFPHLQGHYCGQRLKTFRKAWSRGCREAGVPGMLCHDLRRTAVRNMVNLGIPERVAMSVSGHTTRSVFDRYHIVTPTDLQDAARKLTGTI